MNQTLFALGGLAVALWLALTVQENKVEADRDQIRTEIETIAGQVGTDVLAHVASLPFDEAIALAEIDAAAAAGTTVDGLSSQALSSLSVPVEDLTDAADFPSGGDFEGALDVDDFHEIETYAFIPDATGLGLQGALSYDVDIDVQYVDETGAPSATATYYKEVTVRVAHGELPRPITMTRVVSWP